MIKAGSQSYEIETDPKGAFLIGVGDLTLEITPSETRSSHEIKPVTLAAIVDVLNKSFRENGFIVRVLTDLQKQKGLLQSLPSGVEMASFPAPTASIGSVQSIILGVLHGMGRSNTSVLPDLVGVAERISTDVAVTDDEAAFQKSLLEKIHATNEALDQEGGALSASAFAKALGVSRATVGKYKDKGMVITVARGAGKQAVYPAWQIHAGRLLPDLDRVIATLDIATPLGKVLFFLTPSSAFDGARPLDVLRQGQKNEIERLIAVADQHVHPR